MSYATPTQILSILASLTRWHSDCPENDVVAHLKSLHIKEIVSPNHQWHSVIHTDQFCFG
jgi:hypothetical protein